MTEIEKLKKELNYHLALSYMVYRIDGIKVYFDENNLSGYLDTGRISNEQNLKYIKKVTGKTAFFMKQYLPYDVFKLMPELKEKNGNIVITMRGAKNPEELSNPLHLENIETENRRLEKMITGKGMSLPERI